MKKFTLFLVATLFSALSFAALNPYAYGLSSSLDGTTLTVNYSLNALANTVNVVIMDGETEVKTIACDGKTTKGSHTVEISTLDLPTGKSLTWKVNVTGAAVTKATAVKTYRFFHPSGIDVDNNPESLHFGRILCLEANHSVKTTTSTSGYLGKGYGAGIYAFDPAFEPILNGTNPGFNGNNQFVHKDKHHYPVRRIRISDDGRIFVTAQNDGGCFLWEVNPDDLNSWTKVFEGTASTYTTTTSDGKFIAGTNSGFDVHGSGENLKLLMLSASVSGGNSAAFRCDEYDLGTAKTWSTVPSKTISGANYHIVTNQSNVQYDKDGGVWHIQYRGTCTDALPGLVHINKNGVEDYKWLRHNGRNAGFCFNKDYTKVIVAGKFQNNTGTRKYATIYAVTKDTDGKPVLTEEQVVDMTNIGESLNDFAWDYADNIYAVDNSGEYLSAYALPHAADKVVSTPCASKYAFELSIPAATPVTITGVVKRAIQMGEHVIVLTHEADGTPHIYRVTDGVAYAISQEGVVARDPDNLGDYLSISDIAVTTDGKLVACNYVRCQNADAQVDAGYKRGTNRFYIWDNIDGNPREWFREQFAANSNRADIGNTMALTGSSTSCNILVTARHYNVNGTTAKGDGALRLHYFTINGNNVSRIRQGTTLSNNAAVYYTHNIGEEMQLSASPLGAKRFMLDANKCVPSEFQVNGDGEDMTVLGRMDAATLPAQYNGATYLTIRGMHLMVAPYADADGKVAGVKVLDITKGLDAVELKATVDLTTPVAATAAATAVKADGNILTITLVTDAALHTLTATIEIPEEIVGVVKRAIQIGETTVVLTHETDGTPHIYRVTDGMAYAVSQTGVVPRDLENKGDYLSISDIAVTTDGKLVACNYIRCQNTDTQVDAGYKRGTNRFYIWDDLTGGAREWFTEQFAANSYRADMGYTMALHGSSTACNILVTGRHYNSGGAGSSDGTIRMNYFTIEGGSKTSRIYLGNTIAKDNATYNTQNIGEDIYLSASPMGTGRFIIDADKMVPSEFQVGGNATDVTVLGNMDATTLPANYNGATYLTVNGKHLMVVPYADAVGNVAGVRVMDITNGLSAAKWLKNGVLATPVAATAAATAVKADGNALTITLVTDATMHTFHIKLDEAPIATALNPYAYNLSATWDLASKTLTTNYTLNADAKEVYITLGDGNVEYARRQTTGITRGTHTYALTLTDEEFGKLPQNRGLTWNVIVKSTKRTEYAECETNYSLYHPSSIDIDNNPKNKTFGTIIVAESMHKVKNVEGYLSSGYGAGIYVFNPDFTPAANGTNPGYNGGNIFTNTRADNAGANAYAPRRVRISDDGRIFVTSLNTNGDVLWEVNANNMNTWTKVFTGVTQDANKDLVSGSTFVAGPNAGFDVRGSGADLKLLMLSANTITYGFGQRGFRVSEYNLGTASTWSKAPSKAFPHENVDHKDGDQCYFMSAPASQVQYDKDGGVWYIQYRGTTSKDCPGLVHFTAGGKEDYKVLRNNTNNAGFRFNNDFTKVVIAGDPTVSGAVKAIVYSVSKDADGKPVLTEESFVDMGTVGTAMNDFAWDYANNLYVVGSNKEKVVAYAMPYSGEVTTPCAEKLTIVAGWVPTTTEALNPFAYGLSSELIDGGMNLKINYSLNAPATTAQVIIMDGNTEVKAVACTDLTMGSHTITIPTEGLPSNTDLTWKIVVNGTSLDKVHEYEIKHQFYHPSSVDVDNNPENETFGLVLVNEAMQSVKNTTSTKPYISKGFGAGIFAFDPAFKNTGKYNGGIDFTEKREDDDTKTAYAPRRIRISDDGRIFVTSLNTNGDVLWEVNPSDMKTWTPIFAGLTQDANKDLVNGATFVAGPNAGFDVRGSGDKLQLLMLSSNTQAFGLGQRGFRVSEYDLGNNTSWTTAPSKAFPHENLSTGQCYFINPTASQVQYDKDGGVWYIQYRAEATELLPTLVHFNKDGVEDFKWLRDGTRNAAFRFNNDFTKVAISDQQFVNFYTVSKDASGKPVLTWESGFSLATLGNAINDFAWDYANNFYAVSNSNEWAAVYRLPYDGEVTTPAASKYTFQVKYGVTIDENADNTTALGSYDGEVVTATVTRSFGPNKYLTLTLPFDMNATQIRNVFGNATVYALYNVVEYNATEVHLQFSPVSTITAGTPYILATATSGYDAEDGFTMEGVEIDLSLKPVTSGTVIMVPVLDAGGTLNQEDEYFLSDNALYCAGTYPRTILGLRAYFKSASPLPIRARVVFQDNAATSIPMVETQPANQVRKVLKDGQLIIIRGEEMYNMQGQRME